MALCNWFLLNWLWLFPVAIMAVGLAVAIWDYVWCGIGHHNWTGFVNQTCKGCGATRVNDHHKRFCEIYHGK